MEIANSVAIVTGANRGIGEAFVRALIGQGAAKVYAGARNAASAQHLVEEFGDKVVALELDVTREEQVEAAAALCTDVSIVINNAGAFLNQRLIGADTMAAAREE